MSALEDEREIKRLALRYAVAMDEVDLDAFHDIFVPEGALVVRAPGREKPMGVFQGPGVDGVGMIAKLLGELYESTMHHVTGQLYDVDGDTAKGKTYCLAYHIVNDDQGRRLETLGVVYTDSFVRTPDGWRMHTRDVIRQWSQITDTPREPLLVDLAATRTPS